MTKTRNTKSKSQQAEILREYGPYPGTDLIHGVTFDGNRVLFPRGESIVAVEPKSGALVRELAVAAEAGTAFDGKYLWQLADDRIQKVNPSSGQVVVTIPAPAHGRDSGLTWAEGTLWVGEYRARKIHQIDAETGAILRTIESDRFVTGVSWAKGELWHGTLEDERSDLRRVDPETGAVLDRLDMPAGVLVSGLEADGAGGFYCGGGGSGEGRAARQPRGGRGARAPGGFTRPGRRRAGARPPRM